MFQEKFFRPLFECVNCHVNFVIHGKGEGGFDTLVNNIENIVVSLEYPDSWKL
jgi:hypothetical protein